MKHRLNRIFSGLLIIVFMLTFIPVRSVVSAATNELFISEYIEGSSFNKAIEIYNGTGSAVDLAAGGYTLELYSNGSATVSQSVALTGSIADGDVYVLANGSADPAILAEADVTNNAVINFNGDDAVVLRKNGAVVDAFGQIGFDPGSQWTGGGQDDTLRRKETVCAGDTNPDDAFDASVEWDTYAINTFDGLGSHTATCGGAADTDLVINEIDYDQPGTDTAEFVEIRNNGNTSIDLTGWTLELVNGNGAAIYATIDLSGFTLSAGDYFVACANAATVVNCDLDISPDTNLIQNGAPDAVALHFNDALIDAVSYEGDTAAPYTEGSGAGLADASDGSISRCPDGMDTNQNNVDFVFTSSSTPGAENDCAPPPPPEMCGDEATFIHAVQGGGLFSPLAGMEVAIEGVVVGDFQNNTSVDSGDLNGFYVQEESTDADSDPNTSEGVFVYAPGAMDVSVGDEVRVRGSVSEYNDLTEITASQVWQCSTGNGVTPATLTLPVTSVDAFEAFEGMLVTFPQKLIISEYFNFDRYGEIVLTSERHLTPSAEVDPGPDAIQAAEDFLLDVITLDDGRTSQNPDPALHPNGSTFDLSNLFRGGDTLQYVTGVMDYAFGLYRIQPTQGADYVNANPRTAEPDDVGGNVKVASFNVLNYFSTLDDGVNDICGPSQDQECRGADDANEFDRQRAKIISAITATGADVVGLLEIENNVADEAVIDLVNGLNAASGAGTYEYVDTGVIGTDAIKVALIYKPAAVSLMGGYAILDSSVDLRFLDTKNRPALAQTFMDNMTGGIFTVAVNHLKSKGSACDDVYDPDLKDGAGNCNLTRKLAAEALVDWLAGDPTGSGDSDFLIIGDLNSYDKEDPIDAIVAGGYTDMIYNFLGENAYSYVFDGQTGYLDHALASADLVGEISGVTIWHINADEPDLIDYDTSFKLPNQDTIYAPDAYRSSDHDPVIIGLNVCDEIAPTFDEVSVTPDMLWSANHKYVDVMVTVIASDNFDPDPAISLVSVASNEPDEGLGDGDTADDIVILDDFHFKLRAERSGKGTGRVYTITYQVTDQCGNTATQSVTVTIPKSMKK